MYAFLLIIIGSVSLNVLVTRLQNRKFEKRERTEKK
jgi:hypothetical protein